MSDHTELWSCVKVWNDDEEENVAIEYDRDDVDESYTRKEWVLNEAWEKAAIEPTDAKIESTYHWDSGMGCYI